MVPARCLLLFVCILTTGLLTADEMGHLVTVTELADPVLIVPLSGDTVLQQTVALSLDGGTNRLSFAFGRLEIPLDRLQVQVVRPTEGVSLSEVAINPAIRDTAQWTVVAAYPCRAELAVSYPLKGIEWRVEYSAQINRETETLDITAKVILTNRSRLDFPAVTIRLPGGDVLTTRLRQNETCQAPLYAAEGVPYRPVFIYDPPRYGASTVGLLRVSRDREDRFGSQLVVPGRIRLWLPAPPATCVGEDTLSYLPPREPVDIKLGTIPQLSVTRRLVRADQQDVKSDIRGRLVLFNEEDEVEFEVQNQLRSPVVLHLRDRLVGDWVMVRSAGPFEKLDAETIELVTQIAAGETRKISYVARRLNLEP